MKKRNQLMLGIFIVLVAGLIGFFAWQHQQSEKMKMMSRNTERAKETQTILSAIYQHQTSTTAQGKLPKCRMDTQNTLVEIPACDPDQSGKGVGNGGFEGAIELGSGANQFNCQNILTPQFLIHLPMDPLIELSDQKNGSGYFVCHTVERGVKRIFVIAEKTEFSKKGQCEKPGTLEKAICFSG